MTNCQILLALVIIAHYFIPIIRNGLHLKDGTESKMKVNGLTAMILIVLIGMVGVILLKVSEKS